jgi:outer membrane receptor protein involved in Fe transport
VVVTGNNAAVAACDVRIHFDIPAQSVDIALLTFAQQAQVPALFPSGPFADTKANRLSGEYCIEDALEILLEGTEVEASIDATRQLVIQAANGSEDGQNNNSEEQGMQGINAGGTSRNVLVSAIAAVLAGASSGALAQDQNSNGQGLEEITVTGSRVRQTDGMTTPIPVTALTTSELSNFDPGGTVSEQLDALPQFFSTQTAQRGGAATFGTAGGSYLDMRGLGPQRTLVLLDGSRVMPADKRGSVNVDTLPTALVKTVDVVTGGASAAYGADALGGVTNFVLDREFEGLKMQVGTGMTEVGDGQRWNLSIAGGKQFGERLNVIGSIEARHINQIWRDPEDLDSDWWQRWGHVTNPDWYPGAPAGIPQRLTLPWVASSEHSPTGVIWARTGAASTSPLRPFALNGMTFLDDGSAVRPFVHGDVYAAPNAPGSTQSMSGGPEAQIHNAAFDGGPFGAEVTGRSLFTAARYEFNDSLVGFAQVLVGRSESNNEQQRGWNSLQNRWYATVYRDNAFLPPEVGAAMDAAGLDSFQLHKLGSFIGNVDEGVGSDDKGVFGTYSWTAGFEAALPHDWNLRASWQSGESHKRAGAYGGIRMDRVYMAIDAVRDPATGAIVCNVQLHNPTPEQLAESVAGRTSEDGSPLLSPVGLDNSIRDCVPYDVMGAGNMSKAAQDYVSTPKIAESNVDQDFAEMLLTGNVHEGWGYGPVAMAVGLTWREQSFSEVALPRDIDALGPPLNAPQLGIRGIPIGYTDGSPNLHRTSTIPNVSGSYDVWEWFGELDAPLWASSSSEQRLDGSLSYRSSDYSTVGRVESWKIGLDFQVFEDLRLRTTKSRDVREATFAERFDAQGGGGTVNDPRFDNTSFQITTVSGGNPNLRPEVADTVVAGFVFEPHWVEGLRFSTDWYKVEISDAVGSLGVQRIMDECEINHVAELCAQIERNPDSGNVARIFNVFLNVAQAKVEGIDSELSYRFEPNFFAEEQESFSVRGLAGYIMERSDTPLGGTPLDVAGALNTPDLTALATATYNVGAYGVQLQQLYTAPTKLDVNWEEGVDVDRNRVSSGNYTNLRLSYTGDTSNGGTWDVSLNVTNLFDRNPPIVPSFNARGGSQITPSGYDIFGRRYQIGLNVSF